jgi:glycosyltransferase involved in cell wall biosynthesis
METNIKYTALIRTFNSARTLPKTLASLERQTCKPSEYVIVDSGSTDDTLKHALPDSTIHSYIGAEFNYSEALNQGLNYVRTGYVLIISSHTEIQNENAISFGLNTLLLNLKIGAASFVHKAISALAINLIDSTNFDGHNGLSNTCALIDMSLLRVRNFRPDVFTAEDQEWAKWLFENRKMMTARIAGGGIMNHNSMMHCEKKIRNEYISIAYFSNRKLLTSINILRIGVRALNPNIPFSKAERISKLILFFRLISCRFVKPTLRSRYY